MLLHVSASVAKLSNCTTSHVCNKIAPWLMATGRCVTSEEFVLIQTHQVHFNIGMGGTQVLFTPFYSFLLLFTPFDSLFVPFTPFTNKITVFTRYWHSILLRLARCRQLFGPMRSIHLLNNKCLQNGFPRGYLKG